MTELRLAGKLDQALTRAEALFGADSLSIRDEVALRLELARIYDRVGLHLNTRPVKEALREIEHAESLSANLDAAIRGRVAATKAYYFYRAGMAARNFVVATEHAQTAIELLREADDKRALGEAVHQLGLIHLQMREFAPARELFEESLELDRAVGERAWMLGEYHRHVGFIHSRQSEWETALPHFEKSLRARKEAGAIDASLFAAVSLARALNETGTPEAAGRHLVYALEIARSIPSPVGIAYTAITMGEMYARLGQYPEARVAYRMARDAARSVEFASLTTRAEEALERLDRGE